VSDRERITRVLSFIEKLPKKSKEMLKVEKLLRDN